jgi:hypothetical protein
MRRFDPVNVGLGPQDSAFCSRNPLASDAENLLFDSMEAVEAKMAVAANFYEANQKRVQSIAAWD